MYVRCMIFFFFFFSQQQQNCAQFCIVRSKQTVLFNLQSVLIFFCIVQKNPFTSSKYKQLDVVQPSRRKNLSRRNQAYTLTLWLSNDFVLTEQSRPKDPWSRSEIDSGNNNNNSNNNNNNGNNNNNNEREISKDRREDARCPKTVENALIFARADFSVTFYQYSYKRNTVFLRISAHQGTAMQLVRSLSMKSRKRLARDVSVSFLLLHTWALFVV